MSKILVRSSSFVLILSILLTQVGLRQARAAVNFLVNSTADAVDALPGDGLCLTDDSVPVCTLRAAIQETNALAGSDTVTLWPGTYTLALAGAFEDSAATGDLDITDDLTITGAGLATTIIDANNLDRAMHQLGGILSLSDLTVQNGLASPGGGLLVDGINVLENYGQATISRVAFTSNRATSDASDGSGGGIYITDWGSANIAQSRFTNNYAFYGGGAVASSQSGTTLTISDSTFDSNSSVYGGGALYPNSGNNTVWNSTFTNNSADTGGAIHSNASSVSVSNSTFVGNTATNHGAIDSRVGQIMVQYSTFYNNTSTRYGDSLGSQAYGAGGTLAVGNSILYGTSLDNCDATDGYVSDLGNNLSWPLGNNCPGIQADPLLDMLADNGGPTQTIALLTGSPAIDAGNVETCPTADQRGVIRPQGAACDIGAFESQSINIFSVINTNDSGAGSLRQAILDANATFNAGAGPDEIRFNIPAGRTQDVLVIAPTSALPALTEAVVIDAYTQPGSSPNTLAVGDNAVILVELNGDNCGCAQGLLISAGSTVRGLAIQGGFNNGIEVNGSGSTITGNFISVRPDNPSEGAIISGLYLNNTSNNTVGGSAPADRNLITLNEGTGVSVSVDSGTGNIIRGNNIFSNDSLGIDLAHDEVTFNHAFDPEFPVSGPNNYQNFPVLTVATTNGETLRVGGYLETEPSQTYTLDVFGNQTCDPSYFGEGETYLGSFTVTTDPSGLKIFDQDLPAGVPEPQGISVTATGSGGTSEFSYCRPVATSNLNWADAQSVSGDSTTQQYITDIFQEKWFKVPVSPDGTVTVTLSSLPGSAVSLHRDPLPIYNELINPQNGDLLSSQAQDAAFLPSGSLPSGSLPSGSLPSGSLPSGSLPSGSLPTGYLPSGSLPSGSLPSGSLPSGSLPSGSLPSGSLPSGSLPSGSLPSGSLDAFATAARNSLLGISMDPYATVQTIKRNTYDLNEDLYIRVVGMYSLETPFTLDVIVEGGICGDVLPVPNALQVTSGLTFPSGSYQTLILTDSDRLHGTAGEISTALAKLDTLRQRNDVNGLVIDLASGNYPRVDFANIEADQTLGCASAKNTVAAEIKKVIDAYRGQYPNIQYIVLAGGADVIPFFQTPDVSGLANEKDYIPPVLPSTMSEAGLETNLVQGQDAYGSSMEFTQAGHTLALPELAVGRLVDSATDISAAVNTYINTDGLIVPNSALVTGYDFVGDAAEELKVLIDGGIDATSDTLIQAPGLPPTDVSAWTADQLSTLLINGNYDLTVLTGHFSAGSLLAADYASELSAAELGLSAADLNDMLVLALGCHGGYSIPNSDLLSGISPTPDWAKLFLREGAAGYISATGYAYGDTELKEYGERLFLLVAEQLRTGSGSVSVGQALVKAKQQYLAETAQLTGIDQKTLVEMTLYGLPMMKVDMPGTPLPTGNDDSIVSSTTPVTTGPGSSFGLLTSPVSLSPTLTTNTKVLQNLSAAGTVTTTYLSGADGVVVNPFEPIYPKEIDNVSVSGEQLRGVALRGGTYADLPGVIPLTSSPTTETSTAHLSYNTPVFYPTQLWAPNYIDAFTGGNTRLITFPAQFRSSALDATDGTLREFSNLDLQLYYLPSTWTNAGSSAVTKAAAVSAAPSILGASGVQSGNDINFSVNAEADGSAGVQAVWVLYTGKPGSPYHGIWTPLDLTQDNDDPTIWQGTLTLQSGESAEDIVFMVQAVGGAGLTTLATNLGAYYNVTPENAGTPQPFEATTLTFTSAPVAGTYFKTSTFDVLLQSNGQPVDNALVTLDIGGQQVSTTTDSAGAASLSLKLLVRPDNYTAQASFRGDGERLLLGSNATSPFTINKDTTTLTVTPASATVSEYQSTPFVAVVHDSSGRALGGKSVFFILHNGTHSFATSVIADYLGNATLGEVPLPPGNYTVDAYFNGAIPTNPSLTLNDDYYESSNSLGGSLTILDDTTPPTITATATKADNTPYTAGTWTNQTVMVHFTCTDAGSGVASCPANQVFSTDGTFTATGTATDNAGNSATAAFGPIKIDKTAPTLSPSVSPNPVYLNGTATASPGATDTGSGIASQSCGTISTSSVGLKTVTCTATDNAGNTATATATYRVIYRFDGFLQPINDTGHSQICNSPCPISIFKGGSTVPVKFQLKDANGNIVQATSLPVWITPQQGSPTSAPIDESIFMDPATSGTNFQWDGSSKYIYNWGTQGFATRYYWRIGVTLDDGMTYYVIIGLR